MSDQPPQSTNHSMSPFSQTYSLTHCLVAVATTMVILFTLIEPEVTRSLGLWQRLGFWSLHIATGAIALFTCSYCIKHFSSQYPLSILVIMSGVLGTLAATPVFWLLDLLYPNLNTDDPIANSWLQGLALEFLTVLPYMLIIWWLVNIPLLFSKPQLSAEALVEAEEKPALRDAKQIFLQRFYDNLPEVLGNDIVAISSDLHYLNVYTRKGKTLVLGSLTEHAAALDELGVQIHRSHWVAKRHVKRYVQSADKALCVMSNGLELPVSRRQRKLAKSVFGGIGTDRR